MPNRNTSFGLRPNRHITGGVIRTNRYEIASALASNIYRGSAVIAVNTTKRINVAAAGNRLTGVFQQVQYVDANGDVQFRPYWATGTAIKTGTVAEAIVFDDPDILFTCQVSSASGLVAADIGTIGDIVVGTGSAVTGNSGDMLDQATLTATDATGGQLRVEELFRAEDNAYGQYAKAVVRINEHALRGSATAGSAASAV